MAERAASRPLRLFWSGGAKDAPNFGDDLSPILVSRLSGRKVVFARPAQADMAAIGSIANALCKHAWKRPFLLRRAPLHVWGAGSIRQAGLKPDPRLALHALRGPATRDALGAPADIPLGDPGLLAPLLLDGARPAPAFRIGLIPHVNDRQDPALLRFAERHPDVAIIDLADRDVPGVIARIASCEAVISSSLHGLVTADSFGIPNAWLRLGDRLVGGEWKFRDYFAAMEREMGAPLSAGDLAAAAADPAGFGCAAPARVAALCDGLHRSFAAMGPV